MATKLERLLTIAEVAEVLEIPVKTLRDWRHKGYGPKGIKLGHQLRWRPSEVERWVQEQEDRGPDAV
jgi:excisionase family DNA binding protein